MFVDPPGGVGCWEDSDNLRFLLKRRSISVDGKSEHDLMNSECPGSARSLTCRFCTDAEAGRAQEFKSTDSWPLLHSGLVIGETQPRSRGTQTPVSP